MLCCMCLYVSDCVQDDEEGLINDEMVRDSTEGMYDISNLGKLVHTHFLSFLDNVLIFM